MARRAVTEPHAQMTLLVPIVVKDWIKGRAQRNDRSVNKEAARLFLAMMRDEESAQCEQKMAG